MLNRNELVFQLSEASRSIQELIMEVHSGEYDDRVAKEALACEFQHIMSHLCLAWHRRLLTNSQINGLDDATYGQMSGDIPNWKGSFHLVDMDAWTTVEGRAQ